MRLILTTWYKSLFVLLVLIGCAACGQKGPLRLPPEAPKPNTEIVPVTSKTVVSVSVAGNDALVGASAVARATHKSDANE